MVHDLHVECAGATSHLESNVSQPDQTQGLSVELPDMLETEPVEGDLALTRHRGVGAELSVGGLDGAAVA